MKAEGWHHFSKEVQGAQEVLEDPWVTLEAEEETEEASHQEGPAVPKGTCLEEERSSTKLETGSAPIRGVQSRTSPGEQSETSVRSQSLKTFSHHFSRPRAVTVAEVALVACWEDEVASWTIVVLVECSEVAVVETEVASVVARAWTKGGFGRGRQGGLGDPLDL